MSDNQQKLAKYIADKIGHGMSEKCESSAQWALEWFEAEVKQLEQTISHKDDLLDISDDRIDQLKQQLAELRGENSQLERDLSFANHRAFEIEQQLSEPKALDKQAAIEEISLRCKDACDFNGLDPVIHIDDVRDILNALPDPVGGGWLPMSSAPHGKWILISIHGCVWQACWDADGYFKSDGGLILSAQFCDGWMETPKASKPKEPEDE